MNRPCHPTVYWDVDGNTGLKVLPNLYLFYDSMIVCKYGQAALEEASLKQLGHQ